MEVWLRGQENFMVLYRVDTDGTIAFGGGADARNRNVTWTGTLTGDEIDRLWALLEQHGWLSGDVKAASTGKPKDIEARIKVWWPGGSKHYRLRGENPQVTPVAEVLGEASRRRLGGDLQTLPRPSRESPGGG
jgi:hypothetical protein